MCISVRFKILLGIFALGIILFPGNVVTGQSFSVVDSSLYTVELSFSTSQTGVLIAVSDDETFGSPVDGTSYSADDDLGDNTVVIFVDAGTSFTHDNLSSGTYYYYSAWEYDDSDNYTHIDDVAVRTLKHEPSYHVTNFSGSADGDTELSLTWTDAAGSVLPDGYLIKGSTVSYDDIAAPSDGTEEADNTLVKNVEYGEESVAFSGLDANTTHYFRIWPYTNQGTDIDYKLHTGTLPKTTVKTEKSSQSDIVEKDGFTYETNIPYADHTGSVDGSSPKLWAITIRDGGDGGDADDLPTTLTHLTLEITNHGYLNEIGLYESDGITHIATESVGSSQVTFSGLTIEAADDGTEDIIIRGTFDTNVTDKEQISFSITDANVTADPAGSTFGTFSVSSETDGDKNAINVTATKLHISHVDNPVDVGANFELTVEALDGNDNLDKDATDGVNLSLTTGSGTLSSTTGLTQTLSSGTYEWTDLQYDIEEDFEIEATASGLTDTSTGIINVNPSSDSEVEEPDAGQIAATTIASTATHISDAVEVFAFHITDNGAGGGLPTKVTNIHLKPGDNNDISWEDHIQGVVVYTTDTVTTQSVTITDSEIDISIDAGNLDVDDGTSKEVTISVYLNTSNITDNGSLQMKVDNDPHGFTADGSGSGFASTFTAEVVSNIHTIDVTATTLAFIQQPTEVYTGYAMDPAVTVEAIDANGNRDLNYNSDITLAPDKSSISGTYDVGASYGLATFDNLVFDAPDTDVTLTASSGSLTDTASQQFDVILSEPKIVITHGGDTLDPADDPTDLDFGSVEWGADSTITLTITNTGKADLDITGITDDGDFTTSGLDPDPTVTLLPDNSTTFNIIFSPLSQGTISGVIEVANNDTDSDPFHINVEGEGILNSQSDIVEKDGFTYETNIPYVNHTGSVDDSSPKLWAITIRDGGDGGDADNSSTTLTHLTLEITNHAYLNEIGLYKSNGTTLIATETVDSSQVTFSGLSIEADNDGTEDIIIRGTFATNVTDKEQISFSITDANVTADPAGSTFGTFSLSSKTDGEENSINVTATKLHISPVDDPVDVNSDFALTVEALDENDNRDKDATDAVTLTRTTGSGDLTSTDGLSQYLSSGTYGWTDLQYNIEETFVIKAEASGLDDAFTDDITVNPSSDSEVEEPDAGQIAATTIASTATHISDAVEVFAFHITDNGAGGGLPTKVTNIRLKEASGNNISWTDHIQGVVVYTTDTVTTQSVTITDSYIDIEIPSGNLDVDDGTSKEVTISVYLNTSDITDNGSLQMKVDNDPHGFTADGSGSGFASTFTAEVVSNTHTIDVTATTLAFIQQPTEVYTGYDMDPAVTVEAIDANGNRDLGYTTGITIEVKATGSADGKVFTATPFNGLATFDAITFDDGDEEDDVLFKAKSGSLTSVDSDVFDIILSVPEIKVMHNSTNIAHEGTVSFSTIEAGTTTTEDIVIHNTGKADLEITGLNVTDGNTGGFSLVSPPSTSFTIIPDGDITITVEFAPDDAAVSFSETLLIAHDDGNTFSPYHVNLSGEGDPNNESDIVELDGFTYPTDIQHIGYQSTDIITDDLGDDAIEVGQFILRDGGDGVDADGLPTILDEITFSLSNHDYLRQVALVVDGSVVESTAAGSSVTFSGTPLVEADNNDSRTFSLYVSFVENVTDNAQFQFTITDVTAGSNSSGFAASDGGGASTSVDGDNNRIDVIATDLAFVEQPTNVYTNYTMAPSVTVEVIDVHGNRDLDYTTGITIKVEASGTANGKDFTATPSNGLATFDAINFVDGDEEDNVHFKAESGSLTSSVDSDVFNIILSEPEIKVKHNTTDVAHDGTVSFSTIEAGTTTTEDIVIHNTGKADLEITGLNVTDGNTGGFSLVSPPLVPFTIIPDGDTTITVEFAPDDAAVSFSETLLIAHDDGNTFSPYHVNLSGQGDPNNESDIVEQDGFTYPTDIQHIGYQSTDIITDDLGDDAIEVGQFILRDGGDGVDADGLPTILDEITFSLSNDQYLRQVALVVDGSVVESTAAGSSVTFSGTPLVEAPDNGSKTFSLYVSFVENVTDNAQFQLTITDVTAGSNSSGFAASDGGGASTSVDGDNNRIDVTATQMAFEYVPSTVTLGDPFTVEVKPVDEYGNVDMDEDRNVTISLETGSGDLYIATASKAFDNGIAQWDDLEYNVEDVFTVKVADPAASDAFDDIISSDIEGQMPAAPSAPSVTIQYIADHQMSIQVTKPSGTFGTDWDGYVVFAREGDPNDASVDDTDLDDFTANANYGDGAPNNNSFCVAKVTTDDDATVTVTGLTRGNDYYFVAYAAKEIHGSDNDKWSAASSEVSGKADVQGVSGQGAFPGNTKVTVQWNNYSSSPGEWWDEVMVVGRKGDAVDYDAPSGDGSAYTPSNVFKSGTAVGEGYVVYKGTGESVTVSGLDNSTAYHFRIFVRRNDQWTDSDQYRDVSASPTGGEGQLVITEVADYYGDNSKNYIELYNAGDEDVNLNGWVLDQQGANVASITLSDDNQENTSADMLLRPGEYALIIKSNWDGLKTEFGIADDVPMFTASGNDIPSLDGGEYYVLYPPGVKSTTDEFGSDATFQAEDGVCYERNFIPNSDGTLIESWNEVSSTSHTYTPASDNTNPLPVELVVFRLNRDGDAVNIHWVTASEVNNSHFDLQRSMDGETFRTITTVAGAGNSNQLVDYYFTDYPGYNGVLYYRLKQYDYDGTSTTGPVKAVNKVVVTQKMSLSAPWVNGQKVNTRVKHAVQGERLVVQVYNMHGRRVSTKEVNAPDDAFTLQVDMAGNANGVYIIRVVSRDHRESKRFYF